MSLLAGNPRYELKDFKGAHLRDEESDRDPRRALSARNVVFPPGRVETRPGFEEVFSLSSFAYSMQYFWHPDGIPYLIFLDNDQKIKVRNLSTGVVTQILAPSLSGVSKLICAFHGKRVYMAVAGEDGSGAMDPYVWDGNVANAPVKCFQRPLLTTEISSLFTSGSGGEVSEGTHKVAIIASTAVDYWTTPGPVNSGTGLLVKGSFAVPNSTGSVTLQISPVGTWPTWVNSIQLLITTAHNWDTFYVIPRELVTGLGGTSTAVTVTLVESDLEIRGWEEAEKYFAQISQTAAGAVPFQPKGVLNWGDRVVWVARYGGQDVVLPSDPQNPQRISASRNLLTMPGVEVIRAAATIGGGLYVFSDTSVVVWNDNGDYPVTFGPPEEVSSSMGAPGWDAVHGKKDQAYLLVANQKGLWKMAGNGFPSKPLTWGLEPMWRTADWSFPLRLRLQLDPVNRRIWGMLPLQDLSLKLFCLSYEQSLSPEGVDYSEVTLSGVLLFNDLELVKNATRNVMELWIAAKTTGTAGKVYRQKSAEAGDALLYNDFSAAIDSQYETSPLPPDQDGTMWDWLGMQIRVKGSGNLSLTAKSLDQTRSQSLTIIPMSSAPGKFYTRLLNMQSEGVSLLAATSATNNWFSLSRIKAYFKLFVGDR